MSIIELLPNEREAAWKTLVRLKATERIRQLIAAKKARVCPFCMQVVWTKLRPILDRSRTEIRGYVYLCPEHGEWAYPASWLDAQIPCRPEDFR